MIKLLVYFLLVIVLAYLAKTIKMMGLGNGNNRYVYANDGCYEGDQE